MTSLYTQAAKSWILSNIKQRKALIAAQRSRRNQLQVVQAAEFLEKHLSFNNYNDEQISKFIQRHEDKIRLVMPGNGSNSHAKREKELESFLIVSNKITVK